jgi:hypothetical protein
MAYGGWQASEETCHDFTCDGMPLPDDPSWVVRPDEHGCPRWYSRPFNGQGFWGGPTLVDDDHDAATD